MRIVFFGSFQHYSALILESLITHPEIEVIGVVTTPPMPVGRKQIITKTPVHELADKHHIPVFTPHALSTFQSNDARSRTPADAAGSEDVDLMNVINEPPDFFITAGYGKILPKSWLEYPSQGSLNLHFSLLPSYRGANPAEWAIMCGETKTGISLITMSDKLDGGDILEQSEVDINHTETRETLYAKLYQLGAEKLPQWLNELCRHVDLATQRSEADIPSANGIRVEPKTYVEQPTVSPTPYAALLKRQDGFLPWSTIQKSLQGQTLQVEDLPSKHLQRAYEYSKSPEEFLSRLPRALADYPSLWTTISTSKGNKRMKIISFSPFTVQIESKQPAAYNQIKNQIL